MPGRPATGVGAASQRLRGDLFLTGAASFIQDIELPGMAHAAIVRSPHAHARILGVDTSRVDGALAVLTGEQAAALHRPIQPFLDPRLLSGKAAEVRALAVGKAIYAGQPVAAVVAGTPQAAAQQAGRVQVEWEPLPVLLDVDEALAPGAPPIHEEWGDNVLLRGAFEDGDVDAAFARAERVLEGELRIGRATTAPIETRGYVAEFDRRTGRYTLHAATQNPHPLRWTVADSLGIAESLVRVVMPDIGGSFGLKMFGHPEEVLVCVLARLAGRPVRWIDSRAEAMLFGAREQRHRFRVAFDGDGVIRAFADDYVANVGAVYASPGWSMSRLTGLTLPTGYRIRDSRVAYTVVTTNKGPWQAARGFGKEGANLVMERALDLVAQACGLDPAEARRRNLLRPEELPFRTASGLNIDSGDYPRAVDRACALVGWDEMRAEQERARAEGRLVGLGVAFELTPEAAAGLPGQRMFGFDAATVRMDSSGRVTVLTGVTSPGGGNDTGLAQVVAGELGLASEAGVEVVQGDTDRCPYGFGNYSGRSTVLGAGAAALAAREIRRRLAVTAARLLDAAEDDLADRERARAAGAVTVAGGGGGARSLTIGQVALALHELRGAGSADELLLPLEATRTYRPGNFSYERDERGRAQPYPTYSSAAHAAVVEVDPETGRVQLLRFGVLHDCGTMINPVLVEGQMHGGAAMGIGQALGEESTYHPDGRLATDRFKAYLMPRATDLPELLVEHQVTPSPFTLLGTKGAGEAGVGGAQAAVVNAVADAVAHLGARIVETPASPPSVLRALRAAGGATVMAPGISSDSPR